MPVYMDLHIVPGITAKGVAEAHVLDLHIQHEYQCSCMTYWIDEANDSAFCLIEAPNENAVRELHQRSHGLLPHHIIEVNKNTVASFLGRIYDPEVPGIQKEELKVFNDPAYRTLVLIDIKDPVLIKVHNSGEFTNLLNSYFEIIKEKTSRHGGEIAEHKEQVTSILCFSSSSNALSCALDISDAFTEEDRELINLRISLNSGMPVTSNDRIFGETIDFAARLLYTSTNNQVVIASDTSDISRQHLGENQAKLTSLTPGDEKLLNKIFNVLEQHNPDENFGIEEFCREVGLSKSGLNRHLQTLTSRSPNSLLKEFRMNKALNLLKNGESISNVAFSAGFRSPSYFSKCFKEHYFLSPSDYVDHLRYRTH